jgi:hypothetical protein
MMNLSEYTELEKQNVFINLVTKKTETVTTWLMSN